MAGSETAGAVGDLRGGGPAPGESPTEKAIGPSVRAIPEGDSRERLVCADCGYILYDNPKIVVGVVATWGHKILLCRRAIQPRRGFWALPAGYMELNETSEAAAAREACEEACASLRIGTLLAVYNIPRLSQVQLIYRATLLSQDVAAGPESEAVGLFDWDEIPWDDLAFPSVSWALNDHRATIGEPGVPARGNPAGERGEM